MKAFIKILFITFILTFATNIYATDFTLYDLSMYGNPTTDFWEHSYYNTPENANPPNTWVTHTGHDFQIGENSAHVPVYSYGFGKVQNIVDELGAVSIQHLIENGNYLSVNLLHFYQGSINIHENQYIAKYQHLANEGNTGLGFDNLDSNTHLHLEVSGGCDLAWVPSSEACPGDGCTEEQRTSEYDIGDLEAHYRIRGNNIRDVPFNNRVWYDPNNFEQHRELLPFLSRTSNSPSNENYDVYGIAEQSINGSVNLTGTFNSSSIIVRDYFNRSRYAEHDQGSLGDNKRFLGGKNEDNYVDGIQGSNEYSKGDYLFGAYVNDDNEHRFGYPVKFSFVSENSFIIDNDQQNADANTTNDLQDNPAYNGQTGNKIPGYFLTADLHSGRSAAFAQWKPYKSGVYKIYVHIPQNGANASNVRYKIQEDGADESSTILSEPVDQSSHNGEWVQITTENDNTFQMNDTGYVGLYLAAQEGNSNYDIPSSNLVAFDAVKFVQVDNNNDTYIDAASEELNSLKDRSAEVFEGSALNNAFGPFWTSQSPFQTQDGSNYRNTGDIHKNVDRDVTLALAMLARQEVRNEPIEHGLSEDKYGFPDVQSDHWLYPAAATAKKEGIVHGIPDESYQYKPDWPVTRAQALKIMVKALDLLGKQNYQYDRTWSENKFSDVDKGDWFYDYIKVGYLLGLLDGYGNGKFGPRDNISRSQLLAMTYQAMQLADTERTIAGKYVEPQEEDYSAANHVPTGSVKVEKHGNGEYLLKAEYTEPDGDSLYYYWQAPSGKFIDASYDNSEVTWKAPATEEEIPVKVWVQDGHGLMAQATKFLAAAGQEDNFAPVGELQAAYDQEKAEFKIHFSVNGNTDLVRVHYRYNAIDDWKECLAYNVGSLRDLTKSVELNNANSHDQVYFRLKAIDEGAGGSYASNSVTINYTPEGSDGSGANVAPDAPDLYSLGMRTSKTKVELSWQKVLNKDYDHSASRYEVQVSTNSGFENARIEDAGNPATGDNIYESLGHTVTNLQDDNRYYFRVRAINSAGTSDWSDMESIEIDIDDPPEFAEDRERPKDATHAVDKQPNLRWTVWDPDGDELDYYIKMGSSPDELDTILRAFNSDNKGQKHFDFSDEHHEKLAPNTTYYWQIWSREDGKDRVTKSPIWHFTTESEGSDLAITNAEVTSEIQPDSDASFELTLENQGQETAESRCIKAFYVKDGQSSPFRNGWECMSNKLEPGETQKFTMDLRFREDLIEHKGTTYDNILVTGDSKVRFEFTLEDEQDINSANNVETLSIQYADKGKPEIHLFSLREYNSNQDDYEFWARAGNILHIHTSAVDDTLIEKGYLDYRTNSSQSWQILKEESNNNQDTMYLSHEWAIPKDLITDGFQVRARFVDGRGNKVYRISDPFPVYENKMSIEATTQDNTYVVGNQMCFNLDYSGHAVQSLDIWLDSGGSSYELIDQYKEKGLELKDKYTVSIPDTSSAAYEASQLEVTITDIYNNKKTIYSNKFNIKKDQSLSSPFEQAISIYDGTIEFPSDASYEDQEIRSLFLELDENNHVHTILKHNYDYYVDDSDGKQEDSYVKENKHFYITYSEENGVESKIKIEENKSIRDFALFDGIPYLLMEDSNRLYYSYYQSGEFTSPEQIMNEDKPGIRVDNIASTERYEGFTELEEYVLVDGYLWNIESLYDDINRYPLNSGSVGSIEEIAIDRSGPTLDPASNIRPAKYDSFIYFVDAYEDKFVKLDTTTRPVHVKTVDLPFDIDRFDHQSLHKIAIAANSQGGYLFRKGKVFLFSNGNLSELGPIQYTISGMGKNSMVEHTIDYSKSFWDNDGSIKSWYNREDTQFWEEVEHIKAVSLDDKIHLVIKKEWNTEILSYDDQEEAFKNRVEPEHSFQPDPEDQIIPVAQNKVLIISNTDSAVATSLHDYRCRAVLLNIQTGDVTSLGDLPLKGPSSTVYTEDNQLYWFSENINLDQVGVGKLELQNLDSKIEIKKHPKLVEVNNKLYATWFGGEPYDGSWNTDAGDIQTEVERNNVVKPIAPSVGDCKKLTQAYGISYDWIVENGYLIDKDSLRILSIGEGFSLGEIVFDQNELAPNQWLYQNFDAGLQGVLFADRDDYPNNLWLINDGKKVDSFSVVHRDSLESGTEGIVAGYPDTILSVGEGHYSNDSYDDLTVITKYDRETRNKWEVGIDCDAAAADFNVNHNIALAWEDQIALADLSFGIVPPNVSLNIDTSGSVYKGKKVSLSWEANSTNSKIDKYEIYRISDGQNDLIKTITDPSIDSCTYSPVTNDQGFIKLRIIAYDENGNFSRSTKLVEVISPANFTNLQIEPAVVNAGELVSLNWVSEGALGGTFYQVKYRLTGSSEWKLAQKDINSTEVNIQSPESKGEYEYKIVGGGNEATFDGHLEVKEPILSYDHECFGPKDTTYLGNDRAYTFEWGHNSIEEGDIRYKLFVLDESDSWKEITETTKQSYIWQVPLGINSTQWKVISFYGNQKFESSIQEVKWENVPNTFIKNIKLIDAAKQNPGIRIQFAEIREGDEYIIFRENNYGKILRLGTTNSTSFIDRGIEPNMEYNYYIKLNRNGQISSKSNVVKKYVELPYVKDILFDQESFRIINASATQYTWHVTTGNGYENYEVWLKMSNAASRRLGTTQKRSWYLENLEQGKKYELIVYPLRRDGSRVSNQPRKRIFFTKNSIADSPDVDKDNDGLEDELEIEHGLDPTDSTDAQSDFDADGFSNIEEIEQGTNINDAQDYPYVRKPGDINGDTELTLLDAVLALKISTDQTEYLGDQGYKNADTNGDGRIGVPEAVFILQEIAR